MDIIDKIVEFDKYCETCKYKKLKDENGEEPCCECLEYPTQPNSKKPFKYEKMDEPVKKAAKKENKE